MSVSWPIRQFITEEVARQLSPDPCNPCSPPAHSGGCSAGCGCGSGPIVREVVSANGNYLLWLEIPGNENKTIEEFFADQRGGGGSEPLGTPVRLEWNASVTSGAQALASSMSLPSTPILNTLLLDVYGAKTVGDGLKNADCFFSDNNGVTAKTIASIRTGDKLYWVEANAHFALDTEDILTLTYRTLLSS